MERMPLFIKINEYEEVIHLVKSIRKKLDEARETLAKINDLKNEEDHQLESWASALSEVEKKVDFVDQSLSEPEQF